MSDRDESKSPQEISDTERQLNVLTEVVTDYAIYVLDTKGNVRTWNTGAERIKGYSADEIIGKNFSVFYTDEDTHAEKHLTALEAAAREGRHEAEDWRVRKDGSRFWVNALIYPIRDERGDLTGYVKVTRDITEKLRQEDALERHCQLKQRWYAPAVGGAVVRCGEVLGTPIGLRPSQPRGDRKLTSTPLS